MPSGKCQRATGSILQRDLTQLTYFQLPKDNCIRIVIKSLKYIQLTQTSTQIERQFTMQYGTRPTPIQLTLCSFNKKQQTKHNIFNIIGRPPTGSLANRPSTRSGAGATCE